MKRPGISPHRAARALALLHFSNALMLKDSLQRPVGYRQMLRLTVYANDSGGDEAVEPLATAFVNGSGATLPDSCVTPGSASCSGKM
jgi:hypothetical protein